MMLRHVFKAALIVGVAASAVSASANPSVRMRTASPEMLAATADAAEGSFVAASASKPMDGGSYRGAATWWSTGNEAGNKGRSFGQAVSQSQSGTVSATAVGGVVLSVDAVSPAPEPSTYVLMLGGLALVAFMTRRRRPE